MITNVAPGQHSAVDEMIEDEKANKDVPVDAAAADDREETTVEVLVQIITR